MMRHSRIPGKYFVRIKGTSHEKCVQVSVLDFFCGTSTLIQFSATDGWADEMWTTQLRPSQWFPKHESHLGLEGGEHSLASLPPPPSPP